MAVTLRSYSEGILEFDSRGTDCALSANGLMLVEGEEGAITTYAYEGLVRTFTWNGTTWTPDIITSPPDPAINLFFGCSVALNNAATIMVVGARGYDNQDGAVYVYAWDDGNWVLSQTIFAPTHVLHPGETQSFGASVSISGDGARIVIGAPAFVNEGYYTEGAVYTYNFNGSSYVNTTALLRAPTEATSSTSTTYADALEISKDGTFLLVSDFTINIIYLYDFVSGAWVKRTETISLPLSNPHGADVQFGSGLALSNDKTMLVVGSRNWYVAADDQPGAFFIMDYVNATDEWVMRDSVHVAENTPVTNDFYGCGVSLSNDGTVIAVGAKGRTNASAIALAGAFYIYDTDGETGGGGSAFSVTNVVRTNGSGDLNIDNESLSYATYEITFNQNVLFSSLDSTDFDNAGTANGYFEVISAVGPVLTVRFNATGIGTLRLQIPVGATISSTVPEWLDTDPAILDDVTYDVVQMELTEPEAKQFRVLQHLLPNAKAWRLTIDKPLRRFFEGLSRFNVDVLTFIDNAYLDLFPSTTRELEEWEKQFGVVNPPATTAERRARIASEWKMTGGQTPAYLQQVLRDAGFTGTLATQQATVYDWWALPVTTFPPTPRDPVAIITDPSYILKSGSEIETPEYIAVCGHADMQCGHVHAQCGYFETYSYTPDYVDPITIAPVNYPYIVYIASATWPNRLAVPTARRAEFEELILKIFPAHLYKALHVQYV